MHSIQSNSSGTNWSMVLLVCLYFPIALLPNRAPAELFSAREHKLSLQHGHLFFTLGSVPFKQSTWLTCRWVCLCPGQSLAVTLHDFLSESVVICGSFRYGIVWCACMLFWASAHCLWYFTLQYISTTADRQYGLVMMVTNLVYTMALEM